MGETQQVLNPTQTLQAIRLGHFVDVAYQMYNAHPNNPTPPPPTLPDNYEFLGWAQMRDFVFRSGALTFYGLVAQSPDAKETILAIRGTNDPTEWWDDLTSIVPAPWAGAGWVGFGFDQIYRTLQIAPNRPPSTPAVAALRPPIPFAQQVADLVRQHARVQLQPGQMEAPILNGPITVVGHSLGSALATLYVAENVRVGQLRIALHCTFASPRVGDHNFAASFDALTVESWRIVNKMDVVPNLPIIDFEHVNRLYEYNSGSSANPGWGCCHSLDTYLHLLDTDLPLPANCQKTRPAIARAAGRVGGAETNAPASNEIALSLPYEGAIINITINVQPK